MMATLDKLAKYRDAVLNALERSMSVIKMELALVLMIEESTCVSITLSYLLFMVLTILSVKNVVTQKTLSTLLLKLHLVFMNTCLLVSLLLIVSRPLPTYNFDNSAMILAVGGSGNNKTEILSVEENTWSTLSDYPFVEE